MRVLFVVDPVFAVRERPLISRLEIGLLDEGVGVTLALPERAVINTDIDLLGEPVRFRLAGFALTRAIRARQLVRRLTAPDAPRIDLVHAFGGSAWSFAGEVASLLGVPVALEVWRGGLCERARAFRTHPEVPVLLLAPGRAIERRLLTESGSSLVRLARWGGSIPPEPAKPLPEGKVASIMLIGNGRDPVGFSAAFDAVAALAAHRDDVMLFVDGDATRQAGIWRRAKQHNITDKLTLIDRMEERRDLVLKGDIFVYPESLHEHRTVLLDALAAGLPVVVAADDAVEALIDGRTAVVVQRAEPDAWRTAIESLLDDRPRAREIGANARESIRDGRRFTTYVAAVLDAYEWATGSKSTPILGA
ncbi:MAG: glycosyltransferase [Phycisphaerales bacterium]